MSDFKKLTEQDSLPYQVSISESDISIFNDQKYQVFSQLESFRFTLNNVSLDYCIQGNKHGKVFLTLHDVGQDSTIAFGGFFNNPSVKPLIDSFCIYHVSLPGQSPNSEPLTINSAYPTFQNIAELLVEFIHSINKKYIFGMGIGSGANILIRSALIDDHLFSGLILVNPFIDTMGWFPWIDLKKQIHHMDDFPLKQHEIDYLLYHMFGDLGVEDSPTYMAYVHYLKSIKSSRNLSHLLQSYGSRSHVHLIKPHIPLTSSCSNPNPNQNLTCPVLTVLSRDMPYYKSCLEVCNHIDPSLCETIEFHDAHGMILDQHAEKIFQAILLFLQGLGYLTSTPLPLIPPRESTSFESTAL